MAERPILFSAPMVRSILSGAKTQTRRVLKPQPNAGPNGKMVPLGGGSWSLSDGILSGEWKLHNVDDLLWVREQFHIESWNEDGEFWITYDADGGKSGWRHPDDENYMERVCDRLEKAKVATDPDTGYYINIPRQLLSRPSIFMPRAFSRITLKVTAVKVERLQDISEEDATAEGVFDTGRRDGAPYSHFTVPGVDGIITEHSAFPVFAQLWESINGTGSWDANPWVAAYSFERVK